MAVSTGGGLGYELMHAAQTWRTEASAVLKQYSLTVPQFLVLMALYRQARHDWPGLSQAEVSARLAMDANTTSQIARGLEQRGILAREPHPTDARARALTLTASGLELAGRASATARAYNDRYFSVVSADERAALSHILTTLSTESEKRS